MKIDSAVLALERKIFLTRGNGMVMIGVLFVAVLLAGWSGALWRDARVASLDAVEAEGLESLGQWRQALADIESGAKEAETYDARPVSIAFPAVLRPSSLGDFAVGHSELQPANGEISPWRNAGTIFRRYQFDNPTMLAAGRFDLALIAVLLLPVLMIAVSFEVLARDRARGTLAMIMSHPVSLARLVWLRLLLRNGLLLAAALLGMIVVLIAFHGGGDRYGRFALWAGVLVAYWAVWVGLIACCVARFRGPTGTAAALVALWLLLVIALPASVDTVAEAAYPTPSRLAYLSEIRRGQVQTNRALDELTGEFLVDHPELTVGDEGLPAYIRASFLANEMARERAAPIVEAYERAWSGRARTLQFAQLLSPAIVAQRAFSIVAGDDIDRQHRFQRQASDALDHLAEVAGPAIVSRNRLSLAQFDALEPFTFQERTVSELMRAIAWPVLLLALVGALLWRASNRLFARAEKELAGAGGPRR
ncbi:MAG: DUF3526 domain-containing protein [Pseudomonadota bacterium]